MLVGYDIAKSVSQSAHSSKNDYSIDTNNKK